MQTVKFNEVEKLVHKTIDRLTDLRIRQNREFFNVPPQVALDIFNDIAQTIDDAVVTEYRDNKPIIKEKNQIRSQRLIKERLSVVGSNSLWWASKSATTSYSTLPG